MAIGCGRIMEFPFSVGVTHVSRNLPAPTLPAFILSGHHLDMFRTCPAAPYQSQFPSRPPPGCHPGRAMRCVARPVWPPAVLASVVPSLHPAWSPQRHAPPSVIRDLLRFFAFCIQRRDSYSDSVCWLDPTPRGAALRSLRFVRVGPVAPGLFATTPAIQCNRPHGPGHHCRLR